MKYLKRCTSLLILISFLDSCTVEKRVYMRGFHVEWNKKENNIPSEVKINIPIKNISSNRNSLNLEKQEKINSTSHLIPKIQLQKKENKDTTRIVVKKKKGNSSTQSDTNSKSDVKKKPNPMATFSFGISLIVLVGLIASLLFGWSAFVVFLLLSILAFTCGLIGLNQINRNPDLYDHKWYAWAGIGVGLLELIALFIFIGAIIFYFLF